MLWSLRRGQENDLTMMSTDSNSAEEVRRHCIMGEPYRGYRSPWCGDGLVLFVGPKGNEVRGTSSKREGWLNEAWAKAKAEIDRHLGA